MMDTLLTCVTVDITLPAGKSMMMVTMNVTITSGKVHAWTYVLKAIIHVTTMFTFALALWSHVLALFPASHTLSFYCL